MEAKRAAMLVGRAAVPAAERARPAVPAVAGARVDGKEGAGQSAGTAAEPVGAEAARAGKLAGSAAAETLRIHRSPCRRMAWAGQVEAHRKTSGMGGARSCSHRIRSPGR